MANNKIRYWYSSAAAEIKKILDYKDSTRTIDAGIVNGGDNYGMGIICANATSISVTQMMELSEKQIFFSRAVANDGKNLFCYFTYHIAPTKKKK
jgi:hypothetical protein